MAEHSRADAVWFGTGAGSRLARALLSPVEALYASVVRLRGVAYERSLLASHEPAVPALSVGNLSVGGTGKTPVAAWAAGEMLSAGAKPAIILRGYGDDEPLVHAALHPGLPVIASPDRIAGAREARARGADVIVLDDAFQHRRIHRHADWVLISADRWTGRRRHLLPAGPWREPMGALRRATHVIITRKAAEPDAVESVRSAVRRSAPGVAVAIVHLAPDRLRSPGSSEQRSLGSLRGAPVRLIAAVGDPRALQAQIEAEGATVDGHFFPDHHAFTDDEIGRLTARITPDTIVLCTLKDAVKLAPRWPRAGPALWYVSQRVIVEEGLDHLSRSIRTVLDARSSASDATGAGRSSY